MAKRKYGGQFVLKTVEFGFDIFIAEFMPITDLLDEALIFDERDNPAIKVAFYKAETGYTGLQAVSI